MGVIEDVYADIETDVSLAEFEQAVAEKVEQMGGYADEETAAMLLAHELKEHTVATISDIKPGMDEVKFIAKVRSTGDLRSFDRDEDEAGHVINVDAVDETGEVRLSFWDDHARAIDADGLAAGTILRVKGRPKEGYTGLEVSVHQAEEDPDAEIDVDIHGTRSIADLRLGHDGVTINGRILDTEPVRTFERDDGTEGAVSNLVIGDETGKIRVTLWDDRAEDAADLGIGDSVEIDNGSIRERDDRLECHVGNRGSIRELDTDVSFAPETAPIESVTIGETVDIAGVIRSTDEKRTFERDDGSDGQVRNIRLQDETGDIRVALWGEDADRNLAPGDTIWCADVEIREGWQDALEASVSWESTIVEMDLDTVTVKSTSSADTTMDGGDSTLASFGGEASEQPTEEPATIEDFTFTGTVVQTGDPVIVDSGEEALRITTDTSVTLGEDVTVTGTKSGDRIDADSIRPVDGKR